MAANEKIACSLLGAAGAELGSLFAFLYAIVAAVASVLSRPTF